MKNKWITFNDEERRIAWIAANTLRNKVLPLFKTGVTDRKKLALAIKQFEMLSELDFPHLDIEATEKDGVNISQACVVMRIAQLSDNLIAILAKNKTPGLHVSKHVELEAMGSRIKEAAEPIKSEIGILFGLSSMGYYEYITEDEESNEEDKK